MKCSGVGISPTGDEHRHQADHRRFADHACRDWVSVVAEKARCAKCCQGNDSTDDLPAPVSRGRFPEREQAGFMGVRLFLLRHADDAFRSAGEDIVVSAQNVGRGQGDGAGSVSSIM